MRSAWWLGLVVGCGPAVGTDGDESSSSTTTSTTTSTGTATTSTETTTSAGTSTSSSTGVVDSSEVSGLFITEPDFDGADDLQITCDVWLQDCPRGEKCMPWANDGGDAWTSTRCSPVDVRPAAPGEACTVEGSGVSGIDTCELGAMCWGVDPDTNAGTCVPQCTGSEASPMCLGTLACFSDFEGAVNTCLPPCDPLAPTCLAGQTCAHSSQGEPTDAPFVCLPLPPFQRFPYGSPCGGLDVCDEGLACMWSEHVPGCGDTRCCTQLGDAAAPPECPDAMQTCIPFEDGAMDGLCYCGVP